MRVVANSVNLVRDHDYEWVRMILEEVGGTNDGSWSLLPYLFVAFMTPKISGAPLPSMLILVASTTISITWPSTSVL